MPSLGQRAFCEWLGTAFLLAAVVGSGIMAQKLADGNDALALLCNTLPTGAILAVLILVFGPLSGAHFNPAVSLGFALRGELAWPTAAIYIAAQVFGGLAGVWAAHLMFELPVAVLDYAAHGSGTMVRGSYRDLRPSAHRLRLYCAAASIRCLRRRPLHHRGLLVHGFDIVCQSRRHHCPIAVRHVCGDRAGGGRCFHRRPVGGSARRRRCEPLALARADDRLGHSGNHARRLGRIVAGVTLIATPARVPADGNRSRFPSVCIAGARGR